MPRIAVVQTVSSCEWSRNAAPVESLIRAAADTGAEAVFLPENFGALAARSPREIGDGEVSAEGTIRGFIGRLARELECWIFAGTMPCSVRPDGEPVAGERVRAASFVVDSVGQERARYDKIHMFDVDVADSHRHYLESATFEPGDGIVTVDSPVGRVGLSVCYDIRFPELYRELFYRGAEVLSIPSAFTRPTGEAHFEVLMRARAIECFSFTIAACQGGVHDSGRETWGRSMIVDPWGEILVSAVEGEDVIVADIDLAQVAEARRNMPVLEQRRIFDGKVRS